MAETGKEMAKWGRAIALCGSSREGGNSETVLRRLLRRLEDRGVSGELITFTWKTIFPCAKCGNCGQMKNGVCSLEDDFDEVLRKIRAADFVLLAGPSVEHALVPGFCFFLERADRVLRHAPFEVSTKIGVVLTGHLSSWSSTMKRHHQDLILSWAYRQGMILGGWRDDNQGDMADGMNQAFHASADFLDRLADRLLEIGTRLRASF